MAKVVVVEDCQSIRELYATYLRGAGHQVFEREDTTGLLELLRLERPSVLFLDLSLPHESGVQACERIKGAPDLASIRVIIVSAHSSFEAIRQTTIAGADAHLVKPVPLRQLRSIINDSGLRATPAPAFLRSAPGVAR